MRSKPCIRFLVLFVVAACFPLAWCTSARGQHPWQKPLKRDPSEIQRIVGTIRQAAPTRDLRIVWVWGVDRNHDEGFHEYIKVKDKFAALLRCVPRVTFEDAEMFPSEQQWKSADLVVFYVQMETLKQQDFQRMDAFLKRGGGMIAIHAALIHPGAELAARFGLAWQPGATQWGVLPIPARVDAATPHGIFKGFPEDLPLVDEHYWNLTGSVDQITVLATASGGPANASKGPPAKEQWMENRGPFSGPKRSEKDVCLGQFPDTTCSPSTTPTTESSCCERLPGPCASHSIHSSHWS